MKLDINCIRDVLLELESFPFPQTFLVDSFQKSIRKHGKDNVTYTLLKMYEADFINAKCLRAADGTPHFHYILDLTFKGHEFLADIKPESKWEKLSKAFKRGGGSSLKVIANVAIDLGTEIMKEKLNLNESDSK